MFYDRFEEDKQLEEMASDICKACKTRHNCDNSICLMSVIVAEELLKKYQSRKDTWLECFEYVDTFLNWDEEGLTLSMAEFIKNKFGVESLIVSQKKE